MKMIKIDFFLMIFLLNIGIINCGKSKEPASKKVEYNLKHPESKRLERNLSNIAIQFKNLDPLKNGFDQKLKALQKKMDTIRVEHANHMENMDQEIARLVLQQAILDAPILLAERVVKDKTE